MINPKVTCIKAALAGALLLGCSNATTTPNLGPSTFHVEITSINDAALPTAANPLPANRGQSADTWAFAIEARTPTGDLDPSFNSFVRLSTHPGAILTVVGDGARGRNIALQGGKASGTATVTAMYGPTRLWVEDLGYVPAPPGEVPACSDGKNIGFPADPGCAFADDNTTTGGSYATGVSAPVEYALPKVSDVRGNAATTPYPNEAVEVNTALPEHLIVTRVSSDGFYVTDVNPPEMTNGYNSVFAYNFSTPAGMRVCDRVTNLAGTANDFFGFIELSFPSFRLSFPIDGKDPCEVPEPILLDPVTILSSPGMNRVQSSLVRIKGYHIGQDFGSKLVTRDMQGAFVFDADHSNCDFTGNGAIDFTDKLEGPCATQCDANPECTEYTNFSARGEIKVTDGNGSVIQINTNTVSGFNPLANRGVPLDTVSGTLRKFSGGTLNWTIETRCPDDLVCTPPCTCQGCPLAAISSQKACVRLRTIIDNDQGSN